MGDAFLHGNGGSDLLNFKVVGGTTEPTSPKENTIWVNTSTAIHAWDFSATEPNKRSKNKNLIVYPFIDTTKTTNGITFTDNKDGTITANGTATADAYFRCSVENEPSETIAIPGTYILSGCPSGGGNGTYHIFAGDGNLGIYPTDYGTGAVRTLSSEGKFNVFIRIRKGVKVSNLVFKPQFEKGSTATSFVKGDATGQLWIGTGTASAVAFNALKKNTVMVHPISAKQYVGCAWVDKTAKSYQNGALVEWIPSGALCWYGDECVATTGGWTTRTWRRNSGAGTSGTTTLKKNSNNIEAIWAAASGEHSAVLEVINDVDLTNVNTIDVKYDLSHYPYHSGCIMAINRATTYWDQAAVKLDVVSGNNISASIDVSKLSGSYDIAFGLHISAGQNVSLKVYEVMRR